MPATISLSQHSVSALLALYSDVMQELEVRKVARTANNPAGNYAEWLEAKALDLELATNSNRFDAHDRKGTRYEVKGVRRNSRGKAPQFSAFRNLHAHHFDFFVGVLFERDFRVERAIKVPFKTVVSLVDPLRAHTNAQTLHNNDRLWKAANGKDITGRLRAAQKEP